MQITHYGHACVLVETGSSRLLFDPGAFSAGFEDARELSAILITHQHYDHLDLEKLQPLLDANPDVQLFADSGSAAQLAEKGIAARAVSPGETFDVAGTTIDTLGGDHAVIHPDIPMIPNVAYLLDGFLHPGDSLFVPQQPVDILAIPTGAPWLKAGEAVDYLRAVAPRVAVPIHEAVLSHPPMVYGMFEKLGPEATKVQVLDRGEATTV